MSLSRFSLKRPRKMVYDLDMIEPNLYLSGESEASCIETLKKHRITHILTINDYPLSSTVKDAISYITIKYICLPDMCSSDLLTYFDETYEFIRNGLTRGSVLVHCQMGVSRSASVMIAYLMKKYRIDYRKALEKVRATRCVYPNIGFASQLERYKNMGYTTFNMYTPRSSSRTYYTVR